MVSAACEMMPPKISICIPTYNQINCLRKALDSVVSQDFSDYEVIVTQPAKYIPGVNH